jgi:hypothetical protein
MIGMSEDHSYDLEYLMPCEPACQHLYDTISIIHDQDGSGEYYAAALQDTKYPFHAKSEDRFGNITGPIYKNKSKIIQRYINQRFNKCWNFDETNNLIVLENDAWKDIYLNGRGEFCAVGSDIVLDMWLFSGAKGRTAARAKQLGACHPVTPEFLGEFTAADKDEMECDVDREHHRVRFTP